MRAPEFCELCIVKCLCAEAGAIDTQTPEVAQLLGCRTAGIYLDRDFCRCLNPELFEQCRQNAIELRRREQRRSATTEIDRIDELTRIRGRSYFLNQRTNVSIGKFTLIETGSEVAV